MEIFYFIIIIIIIINDNLFYEYSFDNISSEVFIFIPWRPKPTFWVLKKRLDFQLTSEETDLS